MDRVIPIILAGGNGTRLWPVSRESYPKQFCKLVGDLSLLQATVQRFKELYPYSPLIIVTNAQHYFLSLKQVEALNITDVHYVLEPCSRNTAAAISLASQFVSEKFGDNSNMVISPSDHFIDDPNQTLLEVLNCANHYAMKDKLIVFGVAPTAVKTGYGYIKSGQVLTENGAHKVDHFIEKPTFDKAKTYIDDGGYYWNSGMFMFSPKQYLLELKKYSVDIYESSQMAYKLGVHKAEYFMAGEVFHDCRSASIDYEVMEQTKHAIMFPLDVGWNDLGCWSSVAETAEKDEYGNVYDNSALLKNSQNCIIRSDEDVKVIGLGVKDKIIISTKDAILIADKSYSQEVKEIVQELKSDKEKIAIEHKKMYRPWGGYECLSSGIGFQVKRLFVHPGAAISLQKHFHRSEHWVVVNGVAEITKGEEVFQLLPNQSTYIEKEVIHRLANVGDDMLVVIEVQSGSYLGEDDIVRYEDKYWRVAKENASV